MVTWPSGEGPSAGGGRSSTGSEVVIISDHLAEPPASSTDAPVISNLNVSKSTKFHIGNKFVSVTNNVHTNEVVKDVSCCRYMVELARNTTLAERISCSAAVLFVVAGVALVVYFTVFAQVPVPVDTGPKDWYITRVMWLARMRNSTDLSAQWEPVRLVIIQHTASTPCFNHLSCCSEARNIQNDYIDNLGYDDICYNFLIGNDGRVYEGRGWGKQGAHTKFYNKCSVGIGFFGDYREETEHVAVTEAQLNRTLMLLEEGVRNKYLHPEYKVVGAKDLQATESPGSNLYNAIKQWKHYDHEHKLYRNITCDEIYAIPIGK